MSRQYCFSIGFYKHRIRHQAIDEIYIKIKRRAQGSAEF